MSPEASRFNDASSVVGMRVSGLSQPVASGESPKTIVTKSPPDLRTVPPLELEMVRCTSIIPFRAGDLSVDAM